MKTRLIAPIVILTALHAELFADPEGHEAVHVRGEVLPGGSTDAPDVPGPFVLLGGGDVAFAADSEYFVGRPGALTLFLAEGMSAPGGRVFSDIDSNYAAKTTFASNGDAAFYAKTTTAGGSDPEEGLFVKSGTEIVKIATDGSPAPGGGFYRHFGASPAKLSSNGRYLTFVSSLTGGPGQAVFLAEISSGIATVRRIAAIGEPAPGGGRFSRLSFVRDDRSNAVNRHGVVIFGAESDDAQLGRNLYGWDGSELKLVPESNRFSLPMLSDDSTIVFLGTKPGGFGRVVSGIVSGSLDQIELIVEIGQEAPRGGAISQIRELMLEPSGAVLFRARVGTMPEYGVFAWDPEDGLKVIVLASDSPPGGGLFNFETTFQINPAPGRPGSYYFHVNLSGGEAIFLGDGEKLERIIGTGDTLDGQVVSEVGLYSGAASESDGPTPVIVGPSSGDGQGGLVYYARINDGGTLKESLYLFQPEKTPYERWATSFGLDPSNDALQDDPDRDCIVNLLEFAFGTDPTAPTPAALPFTVNQTAEVASLSITFSRRKDSGSDITYIAEFSSDLMTWVSVESTEVVDIDTEWESVTVSDSQLPATGRRYARVRVVPAE